MSEQQPSLPLYLFVVVVSLVVGAITASQVLAQGTGITIHVATNGSDTTGNGSATSPYRTPERAIQDVVQDRGDTLCFQAGTYAVSLSLGTQQSGLTLTTCAGEQRAILSYSSAFSKVLYIYQANNITITNLKIIGPNGFDPTQEGNAILARESNNFHLINAEIQGGYYAVQIDAYDGDPMTPPRHTTGATIQGCYIHDSDFDAVHTFNADSMIIEDSEMSNTGLATTGNPDPNAQGIDVLGSLTLTVARCYIHDTASSGIQIKGGSTNVTVEENRVVNSGGSGILLGQDADLQFMRNGTQYEAAGSVARNNLIVNVDYAGLGAYSANNVRFYNNTAVNVARRGQAGIWVVIDSRGVHSRDVKLWNNIISVSPNQGETDKTVFYQDLDTPVDSDYNLYFNSATGSYLFHRENPGSGTLDDGTLQQWQQATGADAHSLVTDPLLDPSNLYQPFLNSPAIDHGATIGEVASDYLGVARPQGVAYDIGAYESMQGCQTASSGTAQWRNTPFQSQAGVFTTEFDATPLSAAGDDLIALSNGPQTNWTNLACIVRFNTSNTIDVRNGGLYQANSTINYVPNTIYHVRMAVNIAAHTYSVYVTPRGGSETLLASNYAFRTEQQSVSSLNNWVAEAEVGSVRVCNFILRPAANFYTVTPCRVLDTRTTSTPLTTNSPSYFSVAGSCGIPSNATAVSFNVTAVSATAAVDLQIYPGDQVAPGTNVVSANSLSSTRASAAVIVLATNGTGSVGVLPTFQAPGSVDLVLDVNGYFAP